jgi:hypothetical protein
LDWQKANGLYPIIAKFGQPDWSGTVHPKNATELACQAEEQGDDMFTMMERSFPVSIRKFTTYP